MLSFPTLISMSSTLPSQGSCTGGNPSPVVNTPTRLRCMRSSLAKAATATSSCGPLITQASRSGFAAKRWHSRT